MKCIFSLMVFFVGILFSQSVLYAQDYIYPEEEFIHDDYLSDEDILGDILQDKGLEKEAVENDLTYYKKDFRSDSGRIIFIGENPGDRFGYTIANAGDVNNDGKNDLIVSAPYYNSITGRVYIFFGTENPPDSIYASGANVTIDGEYQYSQFGFSVSSVGDLNNDGVDDIIVGCIDKHIYIFHGGSNLTGNINASQVNTRIYNPLKNDCISSAGDFNNDGHNDIAIGSQYYNGSNGAVFIFFGGPDFYYYSNSDIYNANVIINGDSSITRKLGISISGEHDINGDGIDDLLVSSNTDSLGRAFVFYGKDNVSDLISVLNADVIVYSDNSDAYLGSSVAITGDVNGDKFSDFMIGPYVFFGDSILSDSLNTADADFKITELYGECFVSGAGDLNNDGKNDIVIGQKNNIWGCIFLGRDVFPDAMEALDADMIIYWDQSTLWNLTLCSAGDFNGDDVPDVAVSITYSNRTSTVYLFTKFISDTEPPEIILSPITSNTEDSVLISWITDELSDSRVQYGETTDYGNTTMDSSIAMTHNVVINNFDPVTEWHYKVGYADIKGNGPVWSGDFTFKTSAATTDLHDFTIMGENDNDQLRYMTKGDINCDGKDDIIFTSYNYDSGKGRVYVFFSKPNYSGVIDASEANIIIDGENQGDLFGVRVITGDVNGDGFPDLIISSFYYNNNAGKIYIFFGRSGFSGTYSASSADVVIEGEIPKGYFGFFIYNTDLDNDNIDDIIINDDTAKSL